MKSFPRKRVVGSREVWGCFDWRRRTVFIWTCGVQMAISWALQKFHRRDTVGCPCCRTCCCGRSCAPCVVACWCRGIFEFAKEGARELLGRFTEVRTWKTTLNVKSSLSPTASINARKKHQNVHACVYWVRSLGCWSAIKCHHTSLAVTMTGTWWSTGVRFSIKSDRTWKQCWLLG